MKIQITSDLYQKCDTCSKNRWSNKKKGFFGRGMINSQNDPCKVERIGLLGETALASFLDKPVDFEYKEGGTPFDFHLGNLTLDLKTAARNYGSGLIRAFTENMAKVELKADVYVFAYLESENKTKKSATIVLTGWEEKGNILKLRLSPARVGKHFNYELPYGALNPIETLKNLRKEEIIQPRI